MNNFLKNESNELCKKMITTVLKTEYFYFSYTYDITHSLQQLNNNNPDFLSMSLYQRVNLNCQKNNSLIINIKLKKIHIWLFKADKKYVWNNYLIKNLDSRNEFSSYILPIIHGGD